MWGQDNSANGHQEEMTIETPKMKKQKLIDKMKRITLITVSIGILLFACNNRQPQTITEIGMSIEEKSEVEKLPLEISGDVSFTNFFETFMLNKEFQKSRTVFPFKKDNKTFQTSKDWKHLSFYEADECMPILSSDTLTLYDKDVNNSKIEMSIVDLKKEIADKYSFEKIDSKWFLLSSESLPIHKVPDFGFIDFLTKFLSDSIFQNNHILFPLPASLIDYDDDDYPLTTKTILWEEWKRLTWIYIPIMVLSNIDSDNKYRNIFYRGFACGIWIKYTFEKINGSWKLIRFEDLSM